MAAVTAFNTFTLRDGVTIEQFEKFSRELDRPTCLAFKEVEGFDVYYVERDGETTIDVIEVMTVTSWPDWVAVRDSAPELVPVVRTLEELIETETVTTYFTRRSTQVEEI